MNDGFMHHEISVVPFLLTAYEKVKVSGGVANIYIEGDGHAWLSKKIPSLDPTPKNPVALKLARQDEAQNVIYLARPCQYINKSAKTFDGSACDKKYWTSHRFAPEVIEAMSAALDDIKHRYNITGFNIIGFSGGGNVAALLAARRNDVLSLRTVAGNLDNDLQNKIHNVSAMSHSLNAIDIAKKINHIPQIHFIGSDDKIVSVQLYESYKKASGVTKCVESLMVQNAGHTKNWDSMWKSLLEKSVHCE